MVRVILDRNVAGDLWGYTISGHAGREPAGENLVCAAVSALAQTAVLGLERFTSIPPLVEVRDGWLECRLPENLPPSEARAAQVILGTMQAGLEAIRSEYQQHIRITIRRCTGCQK